MKKALMLFLLFLLFMSLADAAIIHGTVYDMSLEKASGAVIEVNSIPKQRMVSEDGKYSFNLPSGIYTIKATYDDGITRQKTEENITVISDGEYVIDLFLFADLSSEEDLLDSSNIDFDMPYSVRLMPYILSVVLLLLIIGFIIFWIRFNRRNIDKQILEKTDKDLEKIILLLKRHSGRMTQKEIRREIALSEAKISLMITELESKGQIKRIKKGRANIISLQ